MDYYESVVFHYLRANRTVFLNTEYCLQLNPKDNPDKSGPHWYCDAVALNFHAKEVCLCEISYAANLGTLARRLKEWHDNWKEVCDALKRDSHISELSWPVHLWLFVPKRLVPLLEKHLATIANGEPPKFVTKITHLEDVQPWLFPAHNRKPQCDDSGDPVDL